MINATTTFVAPAVPSDAAQRSYPLVAALVRVAMRYREDADAQVALLAAANALVSAGAMLDELRLDSEWLEEAAEWCASAGEEQR